MPEFRNNLHDWQREQLGVDPRYRSGQYQALAGKSGMTHYPSNREPMRIPDLIELGLEAGGNAWDKISELGPEAANAFPLPDYRQIPQQPVTEGQKAGIADMAEGMANLPAGVLAKLPSLLGITAWHGSPHKFDRVDLSKVGTGEGAQAYGHGFYAAESPSVAKSYQEALARVGKRDTGAGSQFRMLKGDGGEYPLNTPMQRTAAQYLHDAGGGNYYKAIKHLDEDPEYVLPNNWQGIKRQLKKMEKEGVKLDYESYLYKLDIPDETIGKMLDWDKPLKDQEIYRDVNEMVQQYKSEGKKPDAASRLMSLMNANKNQTGGNFYHNLLSKFDGDQAKVSAFLDETGIPGIRYLDGTSRSAGKGTSNYVLFGEDGVKVLERNQEKLGGK